MTNKQKEAVIEAMQALKPHICPAKMITVEEDAWQVLRNAFPDIAEVCDELELEAAGESEG